jgi:hypothetical protein
MSTLTEIEAAAESLTPAQKLELLQFLIVRLRPADLRPQKPRLIHQDGDTLLEAAPGAPAMTPENIKHILEDWP